MTRRVVVELVGDSSKLEKAFARSSKSASKFERDIGKMGRGALAGSGAFHSLGRSLAFASGGFIALESASAFLRESINAAREAAVAQRSLAAQMAASGESFDQNRERIEKVALSYGKFGFQNDEVIQSLTVLERGTGKINKAISLQGLTADLARAKNLDLAAAANTVAKVFGGQETALRRAVPGLEKNAHGWDLIRQAQQKLAGQAAANTTASERFAATLHDTQEIVGTALLPTLNQYLTALGKWLQHMNESGKLQEDVAKASDTLSEAVGLLKDGLAALNFVTGSTKSTLKLLFEAFVAFKTLKLVTSFADMASNIGLVGRNAKVAAGNVATLNTELGKQPPGGGFLAGGGLGILLSIPLALEQANRELKQTKKLTADLARAGGGQKIFGDTFQGHKAGSPAFKSTSGVFKGQMVAVRTIDGQTWVLPVAALKAMMDSAGKVKPSPDVGFRGVDLLDPKKRKPATVEQRNTWFDAIINRDLDRVQDIPTIKGQIGRLQEIAALIQQRIKATDDVTRQLTLEDTLAQVFRTIRSDQQQLGDAAEQAAKDRADAAKAAAEAARQEQVAWADVAIQRAQGTVSLQDNLKADRNKLRILQQQAAVGKLTAEKAAEILTVQQEITAITQQVAVNAKEQAVRALQNKIDWAAFNLEKDDATKTLKDNIRDEKVIIGLIKEHIRLVGRNVDDARSLFQAQQNLKDLLSQRKKNQPPNNDPWGLRGWGMGRPLNSVTGGGFTVPAPTPVSARPFGGAGITITNLNLNGVQDVRGLSDELLKVAGTRPQPRRGT